MLHTTKQFIITTATSCSLAHAFIGFLPTLVNVHMPHAMQARIIILITYETLDVTI